VARTFRPPKAIGHDPHARTYDEDAGGGLLYALGDAGAARADGGSLWGSEFGDFEPRVDSGAGNTMLDGTPVPPLPMTAPREIRFGVALVSYAGAQATLSGSRQPTRSKAEARGLADKLRVTAEQDFHAAVQQGDAGSADDVGRMRLGILEPAPEYVLFTLPVDGVGGPIDTPRGYWIVKRLE
jgi:hypothetical protein